MSQKEIPETGRLNIGGLNEGVVIDHIQAGGAMKIYEYLNLEKLDCSVAIIKNARSNKMGKKDIIKIEGPLDIDLNVLGVLDPNLTINIIKDNNIVAKHKLELPETVTGINPLQKSALYHFDRAGVTTLFQIDRPQQTDLSLHLL